MRSLYQITNVPKIVRERRLQSCWQQKQHGTQRSLGKNAIYLNRLEILFSKIISQVIKQQTTIDQLKDKFDILSQINAEQKYQLQNGQIKWTKQQYTKEIEGMRQELEKVRELFVDICETSENSKLERQKQIDAALIQNKHLMQRLQQIERDRTTTLQILQNKQAILKVDEIKIQQQHSALHQKLQIQIEYNSLISQMQ